MARKLTFGGSMTRYSMTLCLCAALTGCQTGAGSRLASNKKSQTNPSATARQNTLPPPNFPTANANNNAGFRDPMPMNQGVGAAAPTNAAFPQQTTITPAGGPAPVPALPSIGQPAPGPQPFGANNTTNRITQPSPGPDLVMPPLPPQNELQRPGISPIPAPQ